MYNSPYQAPMYGQPSAFNQQTQNEMPVRVEMNPNYLQANNIAPRVPAAPPQQIASGSIGLNFGSLIDGTATSLPSIATDVVTTVAKPKKKRTKKTEDGKPEVINHQEEVNQVVYADTYDDTNIMLHNTINQFDMVASEMKEELDKVIASRTLKGRYMAINNVAGPLTNALNGKLAAIKEMNNSIKSINDMEYRRAKDNRNFESNQGDDKAVMDLYNAFIHAPVSANIPSTGAYSLLGPNMNDVMFGANSAMNGEYATPNGTIVYAQNQEDASFNNYINNLTPEQNAMLHEGTTETVIVYDKATGAKSFEVVDSNTMQPVPNMPIPDPMFLSDVTVDVRRKIARNTNLGQVYKVITINDDVVAEY